MNVANMLQPICVPHIHMYMYIYAYAHVCVCECVWQGPGSWGASQECHQSRRAKKENKPKMLLERVKYFRESLTCLVDIANDIANR